MTLESPPPHTTFTSPANSPLLNQIHSSLSVVLRLPATNRWVCEWIFAGLTEGPFHRNLPLPPPAFDTSHAFHGTQQIHVPSALYNPGHHPPPSDLVRPAPSVHTATSAISALFVPVATLADATVGYAFGLVHSSDGTQCAVPSNPFNPPFVGRFAFSHTHHDLLLAVHGGTPPAIGLKGTGWSSGLCREQYTLVVPPLEYSWSHLPADVVCMLSNIEYRIDRLQPAPPPPPPPGLDHPPPASMRAWADAVSRHPDPHVWTDAAVRHALTALPPPAPVSHLPWVVSPLGALSDGLHPTRAPADTSAGMFATPALRLALAELNVCLTGRYFGPSVRMDSLHAITGVYSSSFTGRITYDLHVAEEPVGRVLRDTLRHTYYTQTMSVRADEGLLSCLSDDGDRGEHCDHVADSIVDTFIETDDGWALGLDDAFFPDTAETALASGSQESATSTTPKRRAIPLAPRAAQPPPQPDTRCETCGRERDGKVGREQMLEERKRRNRLSAARSNHRKKERVESLRREVERNKARVTHLRQRESEVRRENEELRRRLASVR